MIEIEVALEDDKPPSPTLLASISSAFRADSPDAPSTHASQSDPSELRDVTLGQ